MSPEFNPGSGRPLTPEEIQARKQDGIPSEVFDAFNMLIARELCNGYATVDQDEVVREIVRNGIVKDRIFKEHMLDVEGPYREAGWKVQYNSPAYNESGRSYFVFKEAAKKRRRGGE